MTALFGGGDAAKKQAAQQAEQNRLALAKSEQDTQAKEQDTATTMAALGKTPRGRRLLMGDSGGSATIGGGS